MGGTSGPPLVSPLHKTDDVYPRCHKGNRRTSPVANASHCHAGDCWLTLVVTRELFSFASICSFGASFGASFGDSFGDSCGLALVIAVLAVLAVQLRIFLVSPVMVSTYRQSFA